MKSIWMKHIQAPAFPTLEHDCNVNVAVVGGGMAGILTAYQLKNTGLRVAVLEKNKVGSGTTGHTTAKVTCQHGLIYDRLLKSKGIDGARQYALSNRSALKAYEEVIQREGIDCQWEQADSYLYALKQTKPLQDEVKAARLAGMNAEFTTHTELPFQVAGAARFPDQAQFHPLKFLNAIAKTLDCYENSCVTQVNPHTLTVKNKNEKTVTVHADYIVIATHYPMVNFPGLYFMKLHQSRSYVLALTDVPHLQSMYLGTDSGAFSLRSYENMILFGGSGHRTGFSPNENPYDSLLKSAKGFFPDCKSVCHWAAQDTMSLDQIPFIGRYSRLRPDLYVASGFKKWGMTSSMLAAQYLARQIGQDKLLSSSIFSPQRLWGLGALPPFVTQTAITVNSLLFKKLTAPHSKEAAKKKGYGPVCTHLGCTLSWNAADNSWDCPCHGSRFTEEGSAIEGPATRHLH